MRTTGCEARHAVNNINGQTEAVDLIPNGQFQWRINVAPLSVPMNVKVLVVGSAIGELVNQRWIAVKVKDHRLRFRKQRVEVAIRKAMWMFAAGLKPKEIDNIDKANLQIGKIFP